MRVKLGIYFLLCYYCYCMVHSLPLLVRKVRQNEENVTEEEKGLNWTEERMLLKSSHSSSSMVIFIKKASHGSPLQRQRRETLDADCAYVGRFPMKNNCYCFVECHLGDHKLEAFVTNCPEGREYSIDYKRCIYPEIARCSHHPDIVSTTTSSTQSTITSSTEPHIDLSLSSSSSSSSSYAATTTPLDIKLGYRSHPGEEGNGGEQENETEKYTFVDNDSPRQIPLFHHQQVKGSTTTNSSSLSSSSVLQRKAVHRENQKLYQRHEKYYNNIMEDEDEEELEYDYSSSESEEEEISNEYSEEDDYSIYFKF